MAGAGKEGRAASSKENLKKKDEKNDLDEKNQEQQPGLK